MCFPIPFPPMLNMYKLMGTDIQIHTLILKYFSIFNLMAEALNEWRAIEPHRHPFNRNEMEPLDMNCVACVEHILMWWLADGYRINGWMEWWMRTKYQIWIHTFIADLIMDNCATHLWIVSIKMWYPDRHHKYVLSWVR